MAAAAAVAEENPAQEGEVFPPGERVSAASAVGAGESDVFSLWEPGEADVEEAAEGEAEEAGEDAAEDQ